MHHTLKTRIWSILGLGALLLMAAGITRMELGPDIPFHLAGREMPDHPGQTYPGGLTADPPAVPPPPMPLNFPLRGGLLLIAAALSAALFPAVRRYFLNSVLILAIYSLIGLVSLGLLRWLLRLKWKDRDPDPSSFLDQYGNQLPGETPPPQPVPGFEVLDYGWLPWLTAFLMALLLLYLSRWLPSLFGRGRASGPTSEAVLDRSAAEAADALKKGAAYEETVLRCYHAMLEALAGRDLRRPESRTPREFEIRLLGAGYPEEAVRRLTRLFESVLYGNRSPSDDDRRRAVDSLEIIRRHGARGERIDP